MALSDDAKSRLPAPFARTDVKGAARPEPYRPHTEAFRVSAMQNRANNSRVSASVNARGCAIVSTRRDFLNYTVINVNSKQKSAEIRGSCLFSEGGILRAEYRPATTREPESAVLTACRNPGFPARGVRCADSANQTDSKAYPAERTVRTGSLLPSTVRPLRRRRICTSTVRNSISLPVPQTASSS